MTDAGGGAAPGRRGCVETFLSGPALARRYEEETGSRRSAEEVWRLASEGEEAARRVTEGYLDRLGFALAQVVNLLDPEVIVLGGGVSNAPGVAEEAPARMRSHLFNDEILTREPARLEIPLASSAPHGSPPGAAQSSASSA
jgi:predicted NBD/HSP70 family sugar kinase